MIYAIDWLNESDFVIEKGVRYEIFYFSNRPTKRKDIIATINISIKEN